MYQLRAQDKCTTAGLAEVTVQVTVQDDDKEWLIFAVSEGEKRRGRCCFDQGGWR